jgi:hypothetical protein
MQSRGLRSVSLRRRLRIDRVRTRTSHSEAQWVVLVVSLLTERWCGLTAPAPAAAASSSSSSAAAAASSALARAACAGSMKSSVICRPCERRRAKLPAAGAVRSGAHVVKIGAALWLMQKIRLADAENSSEAAASAP